MVFVSIFDIFQDLGKDADDAIWVDNQPEGEVPC